MIDKIVRTKVRLIINLAMMVDDSPTTHRKTGDKPTVFVNFSGHTCGLIVAVCEKGWDREPPYNETNFEMVVYLNNESSEVIKSLDIIIEKLNDIYKKWGEHDGNINI